MPKRKSKNMVPASTGRSTLQTNSKGSYRVNKTKARQGMSFEKIIMDNAKVYVASLSDPFNIRGARIPETTPYPSTVGSSVMRYQPAPVVDSVATTKQYAGMCFSTNVLAGSNAFWTSTISAVANGAVTWTSAVHPHHSTFATNFNAMRTVSMAARLVNIAELLARGGVLYVAYTVAIMGSQTLAQLKVSDECEVYDAAKLEQDGITAVYIPMTRSPVFLPDGSNDGEFVPGGSTYVNPSLTASTSDWMDTNIVMWVEGTDAEDLSIEIEQIHNWEAIPFPNTEYLFERKSVVSSGDKVSLATMSASPNSLVQGKASPTSAGSKVTSTAHKILDAGLHQVEHIAMSALAMLPALLFGEDEMNKHRIAVAAGQPQLSPINREGKEAKVRGDTMEEFLRRVRRASLDAKKVVQKTPMPSSSAKSPRIKTIKPKPKEPLTTCSDSDDYD